MPSHYLNQCCVIVYWTIRNKLQWNFNQNTKLSIHETASENIVCETASIHFHHAHHRVNTLRPRQNGRHFADDTFKCIFLNENVWIPIEITQKFVPNHPINNIPALGQIMAGHRPGDKPLSESMMVSLLTHVCVTRPQCVKGICTHYPKPFALIHNIIIMFEISYLKNSCLLFCFVV